MAQKTKHRGFISKVTSGVSAVWQNKVWILFLTVVAIGIFAYYSAMHREDTARATLVLRYEQAYEGLNPNDTRFNISDLMSDTVVERAIDMAGLTGILSNEELIDSIAVGASGSQSPANMYIATEYTISLSNEYLPKHISSRNMLKLLMECYKQYFLENYGSNDSALDIDWTDVEDWEYLEFADIMNVKVNNLITYLEDLRSESGMYQYHTEGESFRSLVESVTNFRDIYLNKYTAYVTNNRLFRNAARYRSKLQYRRFLENQSFEGNTERYEIHQDALEMYDESMIAFMMVPLYNREDGLYMARTSIGMDNLTERSLAYSEKIETNSKELRVFDQSIANTKKAETSAKKYEMADAMIEEIQEHLDSLILRIYRVTSEYEQYRYKNSITYSIQSYGLVSGYNLKGSVVFGGFAAVVVCAYYIIRRLQKENKR